MGMHAILKHLNMRIHLHQHPSAYIFLFDKVSDARSLTYILLPVRKIETKGTHLRNSYNQYSEVK